MYQKKAIHCANSLYKAGGVYDGLFEGMPKVRTEKSFASL